MDSSIYYLTRERTNLCHALLQCTYCITTILPNPRLYVGTTGGSATPKRARRPKRRDAYPVPPLRRTRCKCDTSTERQTRRTTHDHGLKSDHIHAPSTPDRPNTSTALAWRRLCIGARTNRSKILEGDDPNSPSTRDELLGYKGGVYLNKVH